MEEKCVCVGGESEPWLGEEEKKEGVFAAEAEQHSLSVGRKRWSPTDDREKLRSLEKTK